MAQGHRNDRFNPEVGLIHRGSIVGFDPTTGQMTVNLNNAALPKPPNSAIITVPAPHSMFYNNGLFIGTHPVPGTPVAVGQSEGGAWHFVSFVAENLNKVPEVTPGELLVQSNDFTYLSMDVNHNINLGSDLNFIHIQTGNKNTPKTNLISLQFQDEYHITQGYREFGGVVKRELKHDTASDPDSKLEDDSYDSRYKIIGFDPKVTANEDIGGSAKNPAFVEHRELVYEFQYASDVRDDLYEASRYDGTVSPQKYTSPNRRKSRADTLSLSLVSPNHLIETIKGTVVDIFGNVLDLNRTRIMGAGGDKNVETIADSTDVAASYKRIRALERKSLAYHFEINARKDLSAQSGTSTSQLLDTDADNYNAKLLRGRFFIDIDKEGQFKINVPASSETGNIPLPVRYENYSTVSTNDNGNPNQLWFRNDGKDILLDSMAAQKWEGLGDTAPNLGDRGSISLKDAKGDAAPQDRIASEDGNPVHIKHGTVHHDILQTCYMHQDLNRLQYISEVSPLAPFDINTQGIAPLTKVVSDTIIVGGSGTPDQGGPNAGGRSGSINLDGSLELNIGANTIDRQSLWLDTAGGIVANIGHDKQFRSAIVGMDGNFFMQIGGYTVSGDARFASNINQHQGGILDLRVSNTAGSVTLIRVDDKGVTIMSPGSIDIKAGAFLRFTADAEIHLDAPNVYVYDRLVQRTTDSIT